MARDWRFVNRCSKSHCMDYSLQIKPAHEPALLDAGRVDIFRIHALSCWCLARALSILDMARACLLILRAGQRSRGRRGHVRRRGHRERDGGGGSTFEFCGGHCRPELSANDGRVDSGPWKRGSGEAVLTGGAP
jgi:hypothetical protein